MVSYSSMAKYKALMGLAVKELRRLILATFHISRTHILHNYIQLQELELFIKSACNLGIYY